ncbi:rapamycin binding domain protein [Dictyocaulus viviparus]|uniref:Rapamycin binding domain protein n=1 Tax=Dictyocaulus viviparus TaxID=29172 RepID=A0A0D8X5S0_DICVI|nr:rapamycin binding domain protein [Dictyocaulus viviparus]
MVSEELVRCAILWHEQWHDALDEASGQYFQEKNTTTVMETLEPLHKMIEKGPTTLKEQSFNQVFKKITAQLRQLTSLDLNYISPMLINAKVREILSPV